MTLQYPRGHFGSTSTYFATQYQLAQTTNRFYCSCVPRVSSTGTTPRWDDLYESASGQSGYFSTRQAAQAGYSPQLLIYYMLKGRLQRAGRGLWRIVHFPLTDHEDLVPPWLWSNQRGVFSHETALRLHDVSDLLPDQTQMTLPASWSKRRLQPPPRIWLSYADLTPGEIMWSGPVPITTLPRTLRDCIAAHLQPEPLRQAIGQGLNQGLLREAEGQQLLAMVNQGDSE